MDAIEPATPEEVIASQAQMIATLEKRIERQALIITSEREQHRQQLHQYREYRTMVEQAAAVDPLGMLRRISNQRKELRRLNQMVRLLLVGQLEVHHYPQGTITQLKSGAWQARKERGGWRVCRSFELALAFIGVEVAIA